MPNISNPYAPKPPPIAQKKPSPDPSVSKETSEGTKSNEMQNEGEGSRTAARRYDEATRRYVESGRVEGAAKAAEEALDGEEGDELRKAETAARDTLPRAATQRPVRR